MKRKATVLLLCVSMFLLASCSSHLTQSKIKRIEKDVLEAHKKLVAAAENRDADAMFEYILDSDETVIQVGEFVQNRQQALESVRRNFEGFSKIQYTFEQRDIAVLSPISAEMTTKGKTADTTHDGRVLTFQFSQTILFVLTNDGWKIKHAHHIIENS